ncbi:MAG: LysM repeat protein [Crocinitomicaceae bacterium]|jgi:LysM repeat protein
MSDGKLQKLTLTAFPSSEFKNSEKGDEYTVLINPENYSKKLSVEWDETQATGTSGKNRKFQRIIQPDLEIQIVFDGTGIIPDAPKDSKQEVMSVKDQITAFEKIALKYDGDHHKPNHVMALWGDLIFKGVLADISYEYKLFKPDGTALRVVAKVTLKDAIEEKLRAAKENQKSPDLTHVRQVVEGDTLPLMSKKIYGDSKYYLEVAKVNQLTNFRKLTPGQQLLFPPLEKLA